MVLSGLSTRSTRRDLMVLMSRPLLLLQGRSPGKSQDRGQLKWQSHYYVNSNREKGERGGQEAWNWVRVDPKQHFLGTFSNHSPACTHSYARTLMHTHKGQDTGTPQRHPCTHVNQHFLPLTAGAMLLMTTLTKWTWRIDQEIFMRIKNIKRGQTGFKVSHFHHLY